MQSKRQTNDEDERLKFKSRLNTKLSGILTPTRYDAPSVILRLPSGTIEMTEPDLLFVLTHNPELEHSRESAVLAVNILQGRAAKPHNVVFQEVEIENLVTAPEFAIEVPAPRKSSGTAPGFARSKDSSIERNSAEDLKKRQFKQSLADGIRRTLSAPISTKKEELKLLLIPSNYQELTEAEMHYALVNTPEFKHSNETAIMTIDILLGRKQAPKNISIHPTSVVAQCAPQPKKADKPCKVEAKATDIALLSSKNENSDIILLPSNYRELSERELGFVLSHNPEFKHSPESADQIVQVLFGRAKPGNVKFELVTPKIEKPTKPELRFEMPSEPKVLVVPSNYRDFSATELHEILVHELNHTEESASTVMGIVTGMVAPYGIEVHYTDAIQKLAAEFAPEVAKVKSTSWIKSIPEGMVSSLPQGFEEMTEQQLVSVLTTQVSKEIALDVIDVLKGKGKKSLEALDNVKFELKVEEPEATKPELKVETEPQVLLLPSNYRDFSAPELHDILIEKFDYSEETTSLAMGIITGLAVPLGVEFRYVDAIERTKPAEVKKPVPVPISWIKTVPEELVANLPEGFEDMTEQQLVAILVTQVPKDFALDVIDVLKGVKFISLETPPEVNIEFVEEEEEIDEGGLLIPANYREFGTIELHNILISDLGHSEESASLVLKVITGATGPVGVRLKLTDPVVKPKTETTDHLWVKNLYFIR